MKRRFLLLAPAAAAVLAACGKNDEAAPAAAAATSTEPVSIEKIQAEATGFTVGSPMSTRTVYVFFDAQCPHCAALWGYAKPLKAQAKFVWIPIRLLNDMAAGQGAAILAAKDPVQAMDEHEASMAERKGGISAMGNLDKQKEQVKKNTDLFTRFAFGSVPSIVAKHAQSGNLVTHEGALPTPELAALLGLTPPSGS